MNVMVPKKEGARRKTGGRSKIEKRKLRSRHSSRSGMISVVLFSSATGSCSVNQVVSPPSSVTGKPVSL